MKAISKNWLGLLPAVLFFSLVTPPLFAQKEPDIEKLRKLYKDGTEFYQQREYRKSIDSFLEFIKNLPRDKEFERARAEGHYNIACNFSLLRNKKDAVLHLGKGLEYGFRDLDFINRDKDLDPVRNTPEFVALIKKYKKLEEEKLQKFDFKLKTIDGKPIAKKDFLGKVLIVDIWGTWCPPCQKEIPHFMELLKRHKKAGLRIVGLNDERRLTFDKKRAATIVKDFIRNNDINFPCALVTDEVLKRVPNFSGFPTTLFIGRDGRVRKLLVGYHDLEDLEEIVLPLLKEKAPEKPRKGKEKTGEREEESGKTGG